LRNDSFSLHVKQLWVAGIFRIISPSCILTDAFGRRAPGLDRPADSHRGERPKHWQAVISSVQTPQPRKPCPESASESPVRQYNPGQSRQVIDTVVSKWCDNNQEVNVQTLFKSQEQLSEYDHGGITKTIIVA
jgi:hypothetical protein